MSARGCLHRRVSAGGVSKYAHRQTSPWPQRQTAPSLMWTEFLTHTCENVTFPQLCLRTVKITNLVNFTSDKKILVQINLTFLMFKVKAIQKCQWVHSFLTSQRQGNGVLRRCAKSTSLLAFIAPSASQSSARTRIHSAILVIDTSNNASYNQVHWSGCHICR